MSFPAAAGYFMPRSSRRAALPTLLPPKVSELGHLPFASPERELLAESLEDPAWPRETLAISGLEGYLTALLVWPVELQPGAWLPPIWNQGGWKIPPPIETDDKYRVFLERVVGYLRSLDAGLMNDPPAFANRMTIWSRDGSPEPMDGVRRWALGFGRGLLQAAQQRVEPDLAAREAVRTIAGCAGGARYGASRNVRESHAELKRAVLVLAAKRRSRGPLGPSAKTEEVAKTLR